MLKSAPVKEVRRIGLATMLPRWRDRSSPTQGPLLLLLTLLAGGTIILIDAKARWDRVESFCRLVQVGMPADGLTRTAQALRLLPSEGPVDQGAGLLLVREHTLLGTFFCDVALSEGRVISKRVGSH